MTLIPDDVIVQVRDAADIVSVIGEFVELRRTGADYRGPCPFHGGTHRNFAVIPKKQMFYCFVCHEAGDVFSFFMKRSGLDYPQAVREVAGRVGITIPERSTGGPDPDEPLYQAVAVAADWFARELRESPDAARAREYLTGRGYDLDRLTPVGLGFSPKGDAFLAAMERLGIGTEVVLNAGLAVRREDGSVRPRFWGRLLFPIHDLRGRIVGFGGRVIGSGEPKYLNSPESRLFHKGALLYNLHEARNAIRRAERAVVVEGYFDVLRAVESGIEYCVAPLGTALTADQAALLKRYAAEVILLYDSDHAGLRASFRAADELLRVGVRVLVATPPPNEDPDSLVQKGGAAALTRILDDAIDVFERKLQLIERKGWLSSLAGRRRALDRLLPTLRAAADPVTADLYVDRAASALGIGAETVRREASARPPRPSGSVQSDPDARRPAIPRGGPGRDLVRVMLHHPEWRARISEHLQDADRLQPPDRALFEYLRDLPVETPVSDLLAHTQGEERAVLNDLLNEPWGALNIDAIVSGSLDRLERFDLERQLDDMQRRLPLTGETEKLELTKAIGEMTQRIRRLDPVRWRVRS